MNTQTSRICKNEQDAATIIKSSAQICHPQIKKAVNVSIAITTIYLFLFAMLILVGDPGHLSLWLTFSLVQTFLFFKIFFISYKMKKAFTQSAQKALKHQSTVSFHNDHWCLHQMNQSDSSVTLRVPWNSVTITEKEDVFLLKTTMILAANMPVYLILIKNNLTSDQLRLLDDVQKKPDMHHMREGVYEDRELEQSSLTQVVPYIENEDDSKSYTALYSSAVRKTYLYGLIGGVLGIGTVFGFIFIDSWMDNTVMDIHRFFIIALVVFPLVFIRLVFRMKTLKEKALQKAIHTFYFGHNDKGLAFIRKGPYYTYAFLPWEHLKENYNWFIFPEGVVLRHKKWNMIIPLPWYLEKKGIPVEDIGNRLSKIFGKNKKTT